MDKEVTKTQVAGWYCNMQHYQTKFLSPFLGKLDIAIDMKIEDQLLQQKVNGKMVYSSMAQNAFSQFFFKTVKCKMKFPMPKKQKTKNKKHVWQIFALSYIDQ